MDSCSCRPIFLSFIFLSALHPAVHSFAGPRVDIVIGEKAPALERLAADELSGQLKRVYEAEVKIGSTPPPDAPHVIFVGSPETNASMKPFADSWPSGDKKLADQGHLLRSVTHKNKPALLIGGGSPVATYWGVAEFGHRLGIRSMLFGDLLPVDPGPLELKSFDLIIEPQVISREWRFANAMPWDSGAWGLDEYRAVLKQLAKLKFNRVSIAVGSTQPFVHFEFGGVQRRTGQMWGGRSYFVGGDTSGRKVFGGAKVFENPSFSGTVIYEERIAAGHKLLRSVIDAGHELGMTMILSPAVTEFPPEFAAISSTEKRHELFQTQWQAYLRASVDIDGFDVSFPMSEFELLRKLTDKPEFRSRPDRRGIEVRMHDETDEPTRSRLVSPISESKRSVDRLHLSLNSQVNVLPEIRHKPLLQELVGLSKRGCDGFVAHGYFVGDLDSAAYLLSRASFGQSVPLERMLSDLLSPVCGDDVDARVAKGFELVDAATRLIESNDTPLGIPTHDFMASASGDETPPEWWSQVRDCYLNAMNEMYRANTRARDGGRDFTLYWARRCEFAFEYMNYSEAARNAGIAERKKDTVTQIAELEKAIESLNNALNAMAAVARSNSDRGLIAVLNEYGYRTLKKKLAETEAAK